MNTLVLYVVLDRHGKVRRKRGHILAYSTKRWAELACEYEGDSVVEAFINLHSEPLFIKEKVLDGGT